MFFRYAIKHRLIESNPFEDIPKGSMATKDLAYISRVDARKILEQLPNTEWRLLITLARFGGLRTPSETLGLKWEHIDWQNERFTVLSPKTVHQGKPSRVVPIFPELKPYLEAAWSEAKEGQEYVIDRYQGRNVCLHPQLQRIIVRAGVESWPRIFQNLRASCETELVNEFPLHVVTSWLGNSPKVAELHYLKTTEDHFKKATEGNEPTEDNKTNSEGKANKKVVQTVQESARQRMTQKHQTLVLCRVCK